MTGSQLENSQLLFLLSILQVATKFDEILQSGQDPLARARVF